MITSELIDLIATALAAAQGEYTQVFKDETNPHFKSKYETLEGVLSATRPALSKHGIAFVQGASYLESGRVVVTTKLIHKSGQFIETHLSIKPTADTAQAIGSAITYGKRYAGKAILGVDAENDDDGNSASAINPLDHENKNLKMQVENLRDAVVRLQKKIDQTNQNPIKLFSSKNLAQVQWLEKKLSSDNIAKDMHPKIMDFLEGKDLNIELKPIINRVKTGDTLDGESSTL